MPQYVQKLLSLNLPSARTTLLVSLGLLLTLSLLMIASASIPFALAKDLYPMRFFWSQLLYIGLGVAAAYVVYNLPLRIYCKFSNVLALWLGVVALLILTAIFAVPINGSKRWLNIAGFSLQSAELAKMVMVMVAAEYVVRRSADMRGSLWGGWRLLLWYLPIVTLLVLQPDFGSTAVIVATLLVIAFISGAPLRDYAFITTVIGVTMAVGMAFADYRRERLMSFWDPFDDIQDTDYQLSRSLIAFGRGEFSGVGYGDSVQKLSHLPEAHTDFILAITGEELGFIGVSFVLLLGALIVAAIMHISYATLKRRQLRLSYMVFGFATVIFGQIFINAGMNMGILPTKGLTLPFYSFGGSALLVNMMMIGFILKVDKESEGIDRMGLSRNF
ncbi:cell division protein FtsW [Moraxella bovoculi]|uniref:Probable peptidoglycan glycosyltransferase FtsW n=1 Tax=Moraxella bovoculi TaxID=386891 RepID=A0AAC8T8F7_9GAMM|nr:putative peptidoglycan glycosyltransferase FtsW [Moraxella bovoculi]AKG08317.1 cell division protein FtsW [Moraxella bovoculi]AKG09127.1 cell division protein FtsW [Moraxella bovoculi]AKG10962.1 cell division protein FtsW [Moraxella bovoculi]AKG12953.1 cell division protein FtsW [Moraxella bovoculi]